MQNTELSTIIESGINNAVTIWHDLTSATFEKAPEYFLCTHIATTIGNSKKHGNVWLESKALKTMQDANAIQNGKNPQCLRDNGRFDIVIEPNHGKDLTIIEVKSPLWAKKKSAHNDIERLCCALCHGSQTSLISEGVFAFWSREDKFRLFEEWENNLNSFEWVNSKHFTNKFKNMLQIKSTFKKFKSDHYEEHGWFAGCLTISRK